MHICLTKPNDLSSIIWDHGAKENGKTSNDINATNALCQVFPVNSVSTSNFQSIHLLLACFHIENISFLVSVILGIFSVLLGIINRGMANWNLE